MSGWLDRLREAGETATPVPWEKLGPETDRGVEYWHVYGGDTLEAMYLLPADAEWLVLARNTWPLLVAVAEAAEAFLDAPIDNVRERDRAKYRDLRGRLVAALASLREAATE